jgi:predicted Zn-dependent protease
LSRKEVAIETIPVEYLDTLGQVYQQALNKKVENDLAAEMLKRFESASKRYPSDPRMFVYLGDAHAGLKEKQQAEKAYNTAIKLVQGSKGSLSPQQRALFIGKIQEKLNGLKGS